MTGAKKYKAGKGKQNVGEGGGRPYKVTFKFEQRIKEGASKWEIGVRLLTAELKTVFVLQGH